MKKKKDNDDNMFSKVLNDTKGFNELLNKLKNQENEENKYYEKNKFKNNFNLLDDNTFSKKQLKKVINEEKENDSDSENSTITKS